MLPPSLRIKAYKLAMQLREERKWGRIRIARELEKIGLKISPNTIHGWIWKGQKVRMPKQIKKSDITPKKAFILGVMCSDGSISDGDRAVLYTIDKDFAERFLNYIEEVYGLRGSLKWRNSRKQWEARVNSVELVKDLKRYTTCKCHDWRVPKEIKNGTIEVKREFLRGLFDGDGCVSRKNVSISSVHEKGLKDVAELLHDFGIETNLKRGHNGTFILSILGGYHAFKKFEKEIGFTIERQKHRLTKMLSKYKKPTYPKEIKEKVKLLFNSGKTITQISKELNIPPSTIRYWVQIPRKKFICLKCNHSWLGKIERKTFRCPSCNSRKIVEEREVEDLPHVHSSARSASCRCQRTG